MCWDSNRTELLRKLWQDGISASRIAGQLGAGITRNAVIGKVHRLGLLGRAKPAVSAEKPPPKSAPSAPPTHQRQKVVALRGDTVMLREVVIHEDYETAVRPECVVIPISERVTMDELRDNMCRWPLGDPLHPEFRYCGTKCDPVDPYCSPHGRMAYQQAPERRRH